MRISVWSSDVCSSDLDRGLERPRCWPVSGPSRSALSPAMAPGLCLDRRCADHTAVAAGHARGRHPLFRDQARMRDSFRPLITVINAVPASAAPRSEEHTSELQSLMRISYAVFCLKKKNTKHKLSINTRV